MQFTAWLLLLCPCRLFLMRSISRNGQTRRARGHGARTGAAPTWPTSRSHGTGRGRRALLPTRYRPPGQCCLGALFRRRPAHPLSPMSSCSPRPRGTRPSRARTRSRSLGFADDHPVFLTDARLRPRNDQPGCDVSPRINFWHSPSLPVQSNALDSRCQQPYA